MGVFEVMDAFVTETQCVKNKNTNLVADAKIVECGAPADTDNANDGREEGEIVDDFELILSSEGEEFSVRQRIRELEAENKELEEITKIGRGDENEYNYYPGYNTRNRFANKHFEADVHVLSDLSSISSGEFQTPKKRKRHRGKKSKSKHGEQDSRREHSTSRHRGKRREHHHRSDRKRRREGSLWRQEKSGDAKLETILLDSYDSFSDEGTRYDNDSRDGDDFLTNKINRERLRFALAHDKKREVAMGSLKERLKTKDFQPVNQVDAQQMIEETKPEINIEMNGQEKCITIESDSSDSDIENENELRLIALKSAILNKHQRRKKRNAEMAYSPTDFIEDDQFKNVHDSDIDDIMEISPAESPVRVPSPFEEASVDTKPVDMELATSDSGGDEVTEQHKQYDNQWSALNLPNAMNNFSQILRFGQYLDFSSFMQLQNMMDEDTPPPPPSFHITEEHFDENNSINSYYLINNSRPHSCTDIQSISMDNTQDTQDISNMAKINESSDEEEKALRALLLSKCKAKKPTDNLSSVQEDEEEEEPLSQNYTVSAQDNFNEAVFEPIEKVKVEDDNEDAEELRLLLLNNMKAKKKTDIDSAPSILKEAVRRFQLKSQEDQQQHVTENFSPVEKDVKSQETTPVDSQSKSQPSSLELTTRDEMLIGNLVNDEQSSNSSGIIIEQLDIKNIATKENAQMPNKVAELNDEPVGGNSDKCVSAQPEQSNESSQSSDKSSTLESKSEPAAGVLNNSTNAILRKPNGSVKINGLNESAVKTQSIKIVKPNKVINKNAIVKRKALVANGSQLPMKKSKPTPIVELSNTTAVPAKDVLPINGGRLLTKADLPGLKANKLIITLDSVESDSDDYLTDSTLLQFESLVSYSDNASPISLPMESPCGTPTRSNTPIIELAEATVSSVTNLRKSVKNDILEKKIDDLLKQARSMVPVLNDKPSQNRQLNVTQTIKTHTQQSSPKKTANQKSTLSTPVAVRHLPASLQAEYRSLVERMQILEKRKELRVKSPSVIVKKAANTSKSQLSPRTGLTNTKTSTVAKPPSDLPSKRSFSTSKIPTKTKLTSSASTSSSKNLLNAVPVVLNSIKTQKLSLAVSKEATSLKSPAKAFKTLKEPSKVSTSPQAKSSISSTTTNNLSSPNKKENQSTTGLPTVQKVEEACVTTLSITSNVTPKTTVVNEADIIVNKLEKLKLSYSKIGAAMVTHLNKSLVMVEEAKLAKITEIRLKQRLKELLAEVNEVESKIDVEQTKMSNIRPKIRHSHNLLSQLKKRRSEIYNDAVELGKGLSDTVEYRFKDEVKIEITRKSTKLSNQIQFVNSLQTINDLKKHESVVGACAQKTTVREQTADHHVIETQATARPSVSLIAMPIETSRVMTRYDVEKEHLDKMSVMLRDNCDKNCDEVPVPKSDAQDKPDTRDNDKTVAITIKDTQHERDCVIDGGDGSVIATSQADEQQPMAISEQATDRLPSPPPCEPDATVDEPNAIASTASAKSSPARRRALIFEELEKKTEYSEPCFQILEAAEPKALLRNIHKDYHSPLASLRSDESHVDPQSLVCPYDLMGNCQDTDCPFLHLSSLPTVCEQQSAAK